MSAAKVTGLEIYVDGSGAPCTVTYGAFVFAMDLVGEVRSTLISGPSGHVSRKARAIAVSSCEAAYKLAISHMSPEWFAANRRMYATGT